MDTQIELTDIFNMKHFFITADGQHISLRVLRKSKDRVEYTEDTGVTQISGANWSTALMDQIAATGSDPRRALDAVLQDYHLRYPKGFERLPLANTDLEIILSCFEDLRQQAKLEEDEEDFWFRCEKFNEKSALQVLETTLQKETNSGPRRQDGDQHTGSPGPGTEGVWRVALVVSSSDPSKNIPWLVTGDKDIQRVEFHRDFIRWISPRSDELPPSSEEVNLLSSTVDRYEALLKTIAARASRFPKDPLGWSIPEVFSAVGMVVPSRCGPAPDHTHVPFGGWDGAGR